MELRICEHPEPSHIHVPRPSRIGRGAVQIPGVNPADVCSRPVTQADEGTSVDTD
jgi:hypothetical protein